jgi:hypothetical protein
MLQHFSEMLKKINIFPASFHRRCSASSQRRPPGRKRWQSGPPRGVRRPTARGRPRRRAGRRAELDTRAVGGCAERDAGAIAGGVELHTCHGRRRTSSTAELGGRLGRPWTGGAGELPGAARGGRAMVGQRGFQGEGHGGESVC